MSSHMVEIENTLKISKKVAKSLFVAQSTGKTDSKWVDSPDEFRTTKGTIGFNYSRDMDNADFLSQEPELLKILLEQKVKGTVVVEIIDNKYRYGYEFLGNGKMIHFVLTPNPSKGKPTSDPFGWFKKRKNKS
jgi:hypothetical protein